jgi:hypothetical protein
VKENVMLRKKKRLEAGRGFLGGALRCLACSESPSQKKTPQLGQENFFKTRSYIYISPFGWQDSVLCGE